MNLEVLRNGLLEWYRKHFDTGQLVTFLCFLAAGFVVMWVMQVFLGRRVRAWAHAHDRVLGERIIAAFVAPLRVLIFCYFFLLGFDHFEGMSDAVKKNIHDTVPVVYLICVLLFAFRCMDILVEVLRRRWAGEETSLDDRWAVLFGNLGKTIIVLLGAFVLLDFAGQTQKILPLLTGVGFLGAAVALALKETIGNVIGSFEIMVGQLFKEGDRISFGDYDGFVTQMGLRNIQMTAMTGEKITLPNKDLVEKQIRNYSRNRRVRTLFVIGLVYEHSRADVEKAMALLLAILKAHPRVSDPTVVFRGFGQSSLDLQVVFWGDYADNAGYNAILSALNLEIKELFDAARLGFAFPSATVYLRKPFSFDGDQGI